MIGLDTNTILRYLLRDDDKQAQRLAQRVDDVVDAGHTLFINDIVLAELVWVLQRSYDFTKAGLIQTVEQLLDSPHFEFENRGAVTVALAMFRLNKAGFTDCMIGTKNKREGCAVTLTFDRAAAKLENFEHV
jgi:predicted nucleic-acid-binding protein